MTHYTEVACPNCQKPLRVRPEHSGKVIACKYCQHAFPPRVPVECPQCHETLHLRLGYLGRRVTCRHCHHSFRAPRPGPAEEGPRQARRARRREQVENLRDELALRTTESEAARQKAEEAAAEVTRLQAQVTDLGEKLDQALANARPLDDRARELHERTRDVEALREQARAQQAELERAAQTAAHAAEALQRDLDIAREARAQSEVDREAIARLADALRAEQAGMTESCRAAWAEAERQRAEADALRASLGVARAEADALREQVSHAVEERARLAAGSEEGRAQLEAVCREHERERDALRAEVEEQRAANEELRHHHDQAVTELQKRLRVLEQRAQELERELLEAHKHTADAAVIEELRRQQAEASARWEQERRGYQDQLGRLQQALDEALRRVAPPAAEPRPSEALQRLYADIDDRLNHFTRQLDEARAELTRRPGTPPPAPADKSGLLSRLWSRGPTSPAEVPDESAIDRRLEALKLEAAVERERQLRQAAELALREVERHLAALQALPGGAAPEPPPQALPDRFDDLLS